MFRRVDAPFAEVYSEIRVAGARDGALPSIWA